MNSKFFILFIFLIPFSINSMQFSFDAYTTRCIQEAAYIAINNSWSLGQHYSPITPIQAQPYQQIEPAISALLCTKIEQHEDTISNSCIKLANNKTDYTPALQPITASNSPNNTIDIEQAIFTQQFKAVKNKSLFTCETCEKEFQRKDKLINHIQVKHQHLCIWCKSTFDNQRILYLHKLRCKEKPKLPCTESGCNKTFTNQDTLKLHIKKEHLCLHACSDCDRKFNNQKALHKHTKNCAVPQQNNPKEISCTEPSCNRKFNKQNSLKLHIRKDHERRYTCLMCNKNCSGPKKLSVHIEECKYVHS